MKKTCYYLLSFSLFACQTTAPNLEHKTIGQSYFGVKNVDPSQADTGSSVSQAGSSSVRSSRDANKMRKSIHKFKKKVDNFESIQFNLAQKEASQVYILNVKGDENALEKAQILVNGTDILEGQDLELNASSISLPLQNLKANENTIELKAVEGDNPVEVEVLSFTKPESIPGAVHSQLPQSNAIRKMNYVPGRIGIKFLEGTKVRLPKANDKDSLVDESGLSLTTLKWFMKKHNIKAVNRALGGDTQIWDSEEAKAEEVLGKEVANLNLFYYLEVDPQTDIWPLIDELKSLPYIEEAFPELKTESAAPYTPNDPDFGVSDPTFTSRDQWLRNSHVMQNRSADPGPDNDGAWSFTRGSSNVKVAVLDYGSQNSTFGSYIPSTHEDLTNVQTISNVNVTGTYTDLVHGTNSAGVIGASGNN